MLIAVDIDDVLADTRRQFLYYLIENMGISIRWEDLTTYHLEKVLLCEETAVLNWLQVFEASSLYRSLPLLPNAAESVLRLSSKHTFCAVTARHQGQSEATNIFLNTYFPNIITEVHYLYSSFGEKAYPSKMEICKEINADILIEDQFEHARECVDVGLPVLLFSTPWNRFVEEHSLLKRVDNWEDIVNYLDRL